MKTILFATTVLAASAYVACSSIAATNNTDTPANAKTQAVGPVTVLRTKEDTAVSSKAAVTKSLNTSADAQPRRRTLRDAYRNFFPIGAAITPEDDLNDPATVRLLKTQFSSLTPKQAMQPFKVQPKEGVFNWKDADQVVDFAQQNNMKVRGHCLIYSSRDKHMPAWFYLDNGATASRELLLKRMKDHITAEVTRYKGRVYCWDVVNEVISNKKSEFYKAEDPLMQIVGEDYVAKAFEYAHAADPTAKLFYNDNFDDRFPEKRDKIFKMLKKLKDQGVPVDGIGMQCHLGIAGMSRTFFQQTIDMFHNIGLDFQVTELDVSIYKRYLKQAQMALQSDFYSPTVQNEQSATYKMIFDVCRQNRTKVTGVTFWGSFDNDNEKNSLTKRMGKRNFPLLFDNNRQPKKAFNEVTNF